MERVSLLQIMAHVMCPSKTSSIRGDAAPRLRTARSACRSRIALDGFTLTVPRSPLISRPVKTETEEATSIE